MGKIFRKHKPTTATYFMSESQRKKTSRLSFIHGSPQLVAIISLAIVMSLLSGLIIINKQRDSKAATTQQSVTWNKDDANTNIARWQSDGTPGYDQYAEVSNTDGRLNMSLKSGPQYPDGYQVCYKMVPGGVSGAQNFRYTSAEFAYETNEAGANGVAISVDGQNLGILNAAATHQGGAVFVQRVTVDFASLPGGGMQLGQTIKICNYKVGTGKLAAKKTVSVFAYSFRATYQVVTADPAPVTVIGTVKDNNGKGIANVQISNCIRDDIRTDTNGTFSFTVPYSASYCVRTGSGLDPAKYSYVRATNNNPAVGKATQVTYEYQVAGLYCASNNGCAPIQNTHDRAPDVGTRETGFTFVATLKPVAPPPVAPATPTTPAGSTIIDQNRWSGWGFPTPENIRANEPLIEHGNNGQLTINYLAKSYTNNLTSCWTTVVTPGNAATVLSANIASNDAGRNVILLRATGNPDKVLDRATNGTVSWTFPAAVQAGGNISICSRVINASNQEFDQKKTLTVSSYTIFGTGSKVTDTTKPSVKITNYETGSTVNGTIVVKAEASDASGIQYVEIKQGGNILSGQLKTAPYQYSLDTTKYPDGDLKIVALARDNTGNFNESTEVTLTVKNAKPETPAPTAPKPTTAPKPAPTTAPTTTTPSPLTCNALSVSEAENGIRKSITGVVESDPLHPETAAAVLFTTDSSVECTLEAPKTGRFAAGAKVRSQDLNGIAEAKITMTGPVQPASRTVKAPKDQAYGLIRFNEKADYRQLTQGQKVTVKVTFTNDARDTRGGDRNLFVDSLLLVEIPPEPQSDANGSTPPPSTKPEPESAIVPCNKDARVEAEEGSVYKGAKVQSDSSATGKSMVRLSTNAQYVECTLKAPEKGEYIVGATLKSDNIPLQGRAIAQLAMAGNGKGVQKDTQETTGKYDRIRMRVNNDTKRSMEQGESVVVRISVTNASNNIVTKKHLLVDNFELIKIPTSAPPQKTPAAPQTDTVSTIPLSVGEDDMEETSFNAKTGAINIKIEAEKATYRGTAAPEAPEQNASGNAAVRLWSNKNYVEYSIVFPKTDMYSLDFAGRSENYENVTANARIVLDGKKLFGDDIKLMSSAKHNYYTSEKKVSIPQGRHTFRVEFTNDKRGSTGDRNLLIDYLQVRGTKRISAVTAPARTPTTTPVLENLDPDTEAVEAENASYCQATKKRVACESLAIPDTAAYGGRSLVLNKKGDFVETEFTTSDAGIYSVGATLRSMDYKGSAKADIYVDGDKVASGVTPSSQTYRPAFLYKKSLKKNYKYKVKVVFVNDLCGQAPDVCNINNDRNLLVDHLRATLVTKTGGQSSADTSPSTQGGSYKFVSMPDFLNADIGDVSKSPYYKPGQPNSTSPQWERSLNTVLDRVASEGTKDIFIAGDFVEGEWGRDTDKTGIFGPTVTTEQKRNAVLQAGNIYYKQGLQRFTNRGLTVYPAVGDHEVGDNPWNFTEVVEKNKPYYQDDDKSYLSFKQDNIDIFKRSTSNHLFKNSDGSYRFANRPNGQAEGTAFATRPNPEVQLISIDVWRRANGTVIASLDEQQLNWVESVLKKANADGVDWIIVQGHTPIIGPVPHKNSSGIMYQGGANSPLWRLMAQYKVDLYLAGEVHEVSAKRADGITQIAHGGLVFGGGANYLTGTIQGDEISLVIKSFLPTGDICGAGDRLWGTNMKPVIQSTPCANINYPSGPPTVTGTMKLKKNNSAPSSRTGLLLEYNQ